MDNSLTRWKRPIFKIPFWRNSKSSVWNTNFFPRQANQKFFSFYVLTTLVILHAEFGLIWSTPWPDEKDLFFEIPISRNSKSSVWNTNFFPRQAIPKILFVLHFNYTGDNPSRVWFDLDNSLTRWKRPILKIPFSRNSKSSVWKTNFFPRQAIPKIFLFYILITLVILHTKFGLIWAASWPDKKDLILKSVFEKIGNFCMKN